MSLHFPNEYVKYILLLLKLKRANTNIGIARVSGRHREIEMLSSSHSTHSESNGEMFIGNACVIGAPVHCVYTANSLQQFSFRSNLKMRIEDEGARVWMLLCGRVIERPYFDIISRDTVHIINERTLPSRLHCASLENCFYNIRVKRIDAQSNAICLNGFTANSNTYTHTHTSPSHSSPGVSLIRFGYACTHNDDGILCAAR